MLRRPNVLLLSTDQAEMAQLRHLLSEHAMLTTVERRSDLISHLWRKDYDAVFCTWSLPRGTWNEVLRDVQELRPGLPVIVLSSAPENRQWVKVIEAGAFDLLVAPYEKRTVLAVLEQASPNREWQAS